MRNLDLIGPAGSINSNVKDMAQWLRFQLGKGEYEGKRLLSSKAHAETWTQQIEMAEQRLYDLATEEEAKLDTVCFSLEQAIDTMSADREFLLAGDVFSNDLIDGYIELKEEEITLLRMATQTIEFDIYYSL